MKYRYKDIVLSLAICFSAMCLFPSPGSAYCVYNHTNANFDVCGESCHKCFRKNIKSGDYSCCPGVNKACAGNTYITFYPYKGFHLSVYGWYAPVQVPAHGWVSFSGNCTGSMYKGSGFNPDYCKDVTVKVHNHGGKVIYKGGLHPISSSSLDIKCKDD